MDGGKRRDGVSGRALTNVEVYQTTGWIMDCGTVRALKRSVVEGKQRSADPERQKKNEARRGYPGLEGEAMCRTVATIVRTK